MQGFIKNIGQPAFLKQKAAVLSITRNSMPLASIGLEVQFIFPFEVNAITFSDHFWLGILPSENMPVASPFYCKGY